MEEETSAEERREERGQEGRSAFENPPIIKLSFIFRRGLKMKLLRDKPAEPFRRFCRSFLSASSLRSSLCVSLASFPSPLCLFLDPSRSPLVPLLSSFLSSSTSSLFSRIRRATTHSLRRLASFSIPHYTLLMQNEARHATVDLSTSSRHPSLAVGSLRTFFVCQVNPRSGFSFSSSLVSSSFLSSFSFCTALLFFSQTRYCLFIILYIRPHI